MCGCAQVDLPISFSTGETTLVTFTGEGYNPRAQKESSRSQTAPLPDSQVSTYHTDCFVLAKCSV